MMDVIAAERGEGFGFWLAQAERGSEEKSSGRPRPSLPQTGAGGEKGSQA